MMKNTKRIWITRLVVAILTGAIANTASAQPMQRMAKELGLTDEQQQSLADIRGEFRPSREDARAQREAMREAHKRGDADAAAEIAATAASNRAYQAAEMRQRVAEVLTPEQLNQWDALRESRANGREGKGRGRGRGDHHRKGSRPGHDTGDIPADGESEVEG